MKQINHVKTKAFSAVALLSVLVTSPAGAVTFTRYYPGINCKYSHKQASDTFFDSAAGVGTYLKNTSTGNAGVVCPLEVSTGGAAGTSSNLYMTFVSGVTYPIGTLYYKDNINGGFLVNSTITTTSNLVTHSWSASPDNSLLFRAMYVTVPPGVFITGYNDFE